MTASPTQPYEDLAALIERELELVVDRRFDELLALQRQRTELQGALPASPPAGARPALERCMRLHKRLEIEMLRVREGILIDLAQVRVAQRAARGYAPVRRSGRRIVASA